MKNETYVHKIEQNIRLLTAEDVAKQLNISRSFAYHLMKSGKLPYVRLGRSLRVHPRDLDVLIELNTNRGLEP